MSSRTRIGATIVVLVVLVVAGIVTDASSPDVQAAVANGPRVDAAGEGTTWYCAEGTANPGGRADEEISIGNVDRVRLRAVVTARDPLVHQPDQGLDGRLELAAAVEASRHALARVRPVEPCAEFDAEQRQHPVPDLSRGRTYGLSLVRLGLVVLKVFVILGLVELVLFGVLVIAGLFVFEAFAVVVVRLKVFVLVEFLVVDLIQIQLVAPFHVRRQPQRRQGDAQHAELAVAGQGVHLSPPGSRSGQSEAWSCRRQAVSLHPAPAAARKEGPCV